MRALFREVPWWLGPPVIVAAWLLFRFMLPAFFGSFNYATLDVLAVMSRTAALFAAGVMTIVWLVALVQKWSYARNLERQTGLASIRELSWRQFEQLLAEAFARQGYHVQETAAGPDGGVDMVITKDGRQTLVQAKHWRQWKVGVKVVREMLGLRVAHEADGAIVVASGRFTRDAHRFAECNGIELIDGPALQTMITGVQRQRDAPSVSGGPAAPQPTDRPAAALPCPTCGSSMVQRTARRGPNAGKSFWGCTRYPDCRGIRDLG
jgi:restriction system protein